MGYVLLVRSFVIWYRVMWYCVSVSNCTLVIVHVSVHSSYPQVMPPESVRGRYGHSITAFSLGPRLTEVLMFGGVLKLLGDPIAETTILRFGEGVEIVHYLYRIAGELSVLNQQQCTWIMFTLTIVKRSQQCLYQRCSLHTCTTSHPLLSLLTQVVVFHRLEVCLLLPRTFTVCDWTPYFKFHLLILWPLQP